MAETGRVAGKVALVTGAGSGLGRAMAVMLAAEGAAVACTDIDAESAAATADEIGAAAIALAHDVTDPARWDAVVAEVAERLGGLNVLVNNAGIGPSGTIEDTSYDMWRQVHAIDLDGVFLGCKAALPAIVESGGGSIVNISSVAGIIAAANLLAYNSAKAAVRHLTKSVALHCARRGYPVRCNSVHPAFVDTPILDQAGAGLSGEEVRAKMARQIPMGRIGRPEEIAYAVLYLASDESGFMTGAELVLDGGVSAM
jgi:NAD(P)-dependent dehydrogenase (short-subunit alcohol dehydrogenase family)